ncbi:hypothetical protein VU05_01205 [Desulfobulbus sp. F1]|nr:hypothetical protein [Desulfobulbus sp. F1]
MKEHFANLAKDTECSTKDPEFYKHLTSINNFLENLYKKIDKMKESIERKVMIDEAICKSLCKESDIDQYIDEE